MIYKICQFSILVLCIISCQTNTNSSQPSAQESNPIADSLTIELETIAEKSIIPGFAVAVMNNEKVVYKKGFGHASIKDNIPFSNESINFIASISKTFIGLSIMQLVESGKLSLDEEVNSILPYEVINPHFPKTQITVRHLVTHTAGLTDDFDPEEVGEADILLLEDIKYEEDSIQAFMDNELSYYKLGIPLTLDEVMQRYLTKNGKWYSKNNYEKFEPGTKYSYSNMGSELASRIVEIKSGMAFDEYTKQYILGPLGMKNSAWSYDDLDSNLVSEIYLPDNWENPTLAIEHPKYRYLAYSSGGLKSNIDDLSKYLMEMINGSNGKGKLLNADSYKTLFAPVLKPSHFTGKRSLSPLNDAYDVGVFWAVSSTGIRLHNGGSIGVYSFMYFNPKTQSGALGFCNLPDGSFGKIRDAVFKYETKIISSLEN